MNNDLIPMSFQAVPMMTSGDCGSNREDHHNNTLSVDELIAQLSTPLPCHDLYSMGYRPLMETPLDLHSALNNIPKTLGGFYSSFLASPGRSSFSSATTSNPWDSRFSLMGPPLPPPSITSLPECLFSMPYTSQSTSPTGTSPDDSRSSTPIIKPSMSPPDFNFCHNQSMPPPLDLSCSASPPSSSQTINNQSDQVSKYNQLLAVIKEMNKDVRPCYAGNKSSSERLKRSIAQARILVREAMLEIEK